MMTILVMMIYMWYIINRTEEEERMMRYRSLSLGEEGGRRRNAQSYDIIKAYISVEQD